MGCPMSYQDAAQDFAGHGSFVAVKVLRFSERGDMVATLK
jgi:hypothetical protein